MDEIAPITNESFDFNRSDFTIEIFPYGEEPKKLAVLKVMCDEAIRRGYTVYTWEEMDRFCRCYRFKKS